MAPPSNWPPYPTFEILGVHRPLSMPWLSRLMTAKQGGAIPWAARRKDRGHPTTPLRECPSRVLEWRGAGQPRRNAVSFKVEPEETWRTVVLNRWKSICPSCFDAEAEKAGYALSVRSRGGNFLERHSRAGAAVWEETALGKAISATAMRTVDTAR